MKFLSNLDLSSDFQFFASARIAQQPPEPLAFFTGLKKVSKERTALAAGMTVRLEGWLIQYCCLEWCASLIWHSVFDVASVICIYLFFIATADSTAAVENHNTTTSDFDLCATQTN
jgi:hypothetical protein